MYIYKITNLVNNKCYIGQTIRSVEKRWSEHKYSVKSNYYNFDHSILHKALKKYGIDNFSVEILEKVNTLEELDEKERFYITKFDSLSPNGYNTETGGNKNKKLSFITISKIKLTRKRKPVIATNLITKEETFYNSILETRKDGFWDKEVKECCDNVIDMYKGFSFRYANEDPKNVKFREVKRKSIPIIGTNIDTNEVKIYTSISQAGKDGFDRKSIKLCLDKIQKQHKNYIWKYKEEV